MKLSWFMMTHSCMLSVLRCTAICCNLHLQFTPFGTASHYATRTDHGSVDMGLSHQSPRSLSVLAGLGVISFSMTPHSASVGCIVILGRVGRHCEDVGLVPGVRIFVVFDIQFCNGANLQTSPTNSKQ